MTSKQRIDAVLTGQRPDRVPWLPELNDGFIRKVIRQRGPAPEGVDDQTFVNQVIGADQLARLKAVREQWRHVEVVEDAEAPNTTYVTPKGQLVHRRQPDETAQTQYTVGHLIAGPESFEPYKALIEDPEYIPDYDQAQAVIDRVGETGLATIDAPATPLMHLIMWDMGIEPTLMALFDYPDQMADMMDLMHERNKEYYRIAAAGPGRVVRLMEDTSSKLTSPAMYAEHAVDHLKDYADICHEHGKVFIVHMCGHLGDMLDVIARVPLDGIEAITPPPTGDADLSEIRRRLGDIFLLGGVDPTTYATLEAGELRARVADLLERMKGDRRLILGHEEIPVTAKLDNVLAIGELIEQTRDGFYD